MHNYFLFCAFFKVEYSRASESAEKNCRGSPHYADSKSVIIFFLEDREVKKNLFFPRGCCLWWNKVDMRIERS